MIATVVVIVVLIYLAFHIGAGHTHYRYRKAHGLSPNLYWSAARGPYASIRVGGFRVGHHV